jgi:hypothetical protein
MKRESQFVPQWEEFESPVALASIKREKWKAMEKLETLNYGGSIIMLEVFEALSSRPSEDNRG